MSIHWHSSVGRNALRGHAVYRVAMEG